MHLAEKQERPLPCTGLARAAGSLEKTAHPTARPLVQCIPECSSCSVHSAIRFRFQFLVGSVQILKQRERKLRRQAEAAQQRSLAEGAGRALYRALHMCTFRMARTSLLRAAQAGRCCPAGHGHTSHLHWGNICLAELLRLPSLACAISWRSRAGAEQEPADNSGAQAPARKRKRGAADGAAGPDQDDGDAPAGMFTLYANSSECSGWRSSNPQQVFVRPDAKLDIFW